MEIVVDIEKLVRKYEKELERPLTTWAARMEALVAGALDHDDIEGIALTCAAVADEAVAAAKANEMPPESRKNRKGSRVVDLTPTWQAVSHYLLRDLLDVDAGDEVHDFAARELTRMGAISDDWLRDRRVVRG